MTISEVFNGAADLLDSSGWCQNKNKNSDGSYCAVGAIFRVAMGVDDRSQEKDCGPEEMSAIGRKYSSEIGLAHAAVEQLESYLGRASTIWNDLPGQTASVVVGALRSAARQEVTD